MTTIDNITIGTLVNHDPMSSESETLFTAFPTVPHTDENKTVVHGFPNESFSWWDYVFRALWWKRSY